MKECRLSEGSVELLSQCLFVRNSLSLQKNPDASLIDNGKTYRREGRKVLQPIRKKTQKCGWTLLAARCVQMRLCLSEDSAWAPFSS